jgi:hypothetical protein
MHANTMKNKIILLFLSLFFFSTLASPALAGPVCSGSDCSTFAIAVILRDFILFLPFFMPGLIFIILGMIGLRYSRKNKGKFKKLAKTSIATGIILAILVVFVILQGYKFA